MLIQKLFKGPSEDHNSTALKNTTYRHNCARAAMCNVEKPGIEADLNVDLKEIYMDAPYVININNIPDTLKEQ